MGLNVKPESVEVSEPSFSNELLPQGKYLAVVHSIRDEDRVSGENSKSPGSSYSQLSIRFEIIEGEHSGRNLFKNVIYEHSTSDAAASIGLEFLKRLYVAGRCEGDITEESLSAAAPVLIGVKVTPERNGYPARNDISFVAEAPNDPPAASQPLGTTEW